MCIFNVNMLQKKKKKKKIRILDAEDLMMNLVASRTESSILVEL